MRNCIQTKGCFEILAKNKTDNIIFQETYQNTVLLGGRMSLARSLTNQFGDSYQYIVIRMLLGDGGTTGGIKKFVNEERTGLFGLTRASKPVISSVDPSVPYEAVFSTTLTFSELVGIPINEAALQMLNGQLYSMLTFPDFNKTSDMSVTLSWRLTFL